MMTIRIQSVAAACCLLLPALVSANPNNEDVHKVLAVFGGDEVKRWQAQAAELYASCLEDFKTFSEADEKGRLGRLSGKEIGQFRVKLEQLKRIGEFLQLFGEPCGADLELRAQELIAREPFTQKWRALPSSRRYINSLEVTFQKQRVQRLKVIEKIMKLAQKEQWSQAEQEFYRVWDGLHVALFVMPSNYRKGVAGEFMFVQGKVIPAMFEIRRTAAKQQLTKARTEQLPDFAAITAELAKTVNGIAATGQADWDGAAVSGPAAVEKLAERWRDVHVATLRCLAIDWAFASRLGRVGKTLDSASVKSQYAKFSAASADAVTKLIAADAARVSEAEAASLYTAYLRSLAPLARVIADQTAIPKWETALATLAAKSPSLAAEVQAYTTATGELLRWRARVATALAVAKSDQKLLLPTRMLDATRQETNYGGFYSQGMLPFLRESIPKLLPHAASKLIDTPAVALDVLRVSPTSRAAISRYRLRTYANVPATLDLAREVASLKADLLVSDQAPPLSLAAAISAHSAERGDFVSAGGTIDKVYVEGLITRFAALPTAASVLVPLGATLGETKPPHHRDVLFRFDLKPAWVRHDHFFAELPVAE